MVERRSIPECIGPADRDLYWGEFHKHVTPPQQGKTVEDIVVEAKRHLDVYAVLCYPFEWFMKGKWDGVREETVGNRPEFNEWWDRILQATADHHDSGSFVALPAYEWHGDRTQWGDHNVIYFDDEGSLDDYQHIADLYDELKDHDALALPHHTGYAVGNRGKDWTAFDPECSPVMEVYSGHGSSEGIDTPFPMNDNESMAPRTSGGTYVDALDLGLRVGAIASNDGWGFPGTWGNGLAGLWASDLSREGVREALRSRRTYGVTGDRMALWWTLDRHPMGAVVKANDVDGPEATVTVDGQRRLDRIELVHNGRVHETYCHQDTVAKTPYPPGEYTVLVEFGWGPSSNYGDFEDTTVAWNGTVSVKRGTVRSIQPRIHAFDQRCRRVDDSTCRFEFVTDRSGGTGASPIQGLILSIKADSDAVLVIDFEDDSVDHEPVRIPIEDAIDRSHLVTFDDDVRTRFKDEFWLPPEKVDNADIYFHNALKLKIHATHADSECSASVRFTDLPMPSGGEDDYYYVRASQVDGQYAWSSPIWIEGN